MKVSKRTSRKATVDIRIGDPESGGSGYVYSGDYRSRIGFSPMSTVTTHEKTSDPEPIAFWQTNWGEPAKRDVPYMVDALRKAFPDREILPA